jgi:transcriptional regulator with XRE-family HTH domain
VEHAESEPRPPGEGSLQEAIGRQIREFRTALGMTVADLGRQSDLSAGAISKIERGLTPPSLTSLSAIAGALAVPVTALFRKHEEQRDASYVPAGKGLVIERRGTRVGHRYELLGHTIGKRVSVEPYLISLDQQSEVFPLFQHAGVELIHVLEGEVVYRAAGSTYHLRAGDSLMFDGNTPHGPEELLVLPIRLLSVITRAADE